MKDSFPFFFSLLHFRFAELTKMGMSHFIGPEITGLWWWRMAQSRAPWLLCRSGDSQLPGMLNGTAGPKAWEESWGSEGKVDNMSCHQPLHLLESTVPPMRENRKKFIYTNILYQLINCFGGRSNQKSMCVTPLQVHVRKAIPALSLTSMNLRQVENLGRRSCVQKHNDVIYL